MSSSFYRKSGSGSFDFKRTPWYQRIIEETRIYRTTLLRFSVIVSALILTGSFILSFAGIRPISYPVSIAFALSLLVEYYVFARFQSRSLYYHAVLFQIFLGFLFSLYFPGGYGMFVIILVVFPAIAVQLRGSNTGFVWTTFLYASFFVSWLLHRLGFSPWYEALSGETVCMSLLASVIIFAISFFSNRRNDSMVHRLTRLMLFNHITGLPNRDVLPYSIDNSKPYILAIVKIENFTDLSAHFGFDFSDTITAFAAKKLQELESPFDFRTYQLKYNEFALLIRRNTVPSIADAVQFLTEITSQLGFDSLPWENDSIRLVYRVGATVMDPAHPDDQRTALSKADLALKKAGRGQSAITMFSGGWDDRDMTFNYTERFSELVKNRENGTFKAVFQPILKSDGLEVAWYEALMRIMHADGTYSSIYPYLGVARSTGFYHYLTDFMLKETAKMIREHDVNVSVNISISDIVRPEFIALIDEVYDSIRHKKGRIIFEILESDELVQLDKCIWFIEYISRYGFRIAIDDFGSGYSNYISLISLPVDIVKIDGALIRKIHSDESARTLVEGIVHFCRKANKKTVAEFVENKCVFDSLKDMDIDYLQGYYLAEPGVFGPASVIVYD